MKKVLLIGLSFLFLTACGGEPQSAVTPAIPVVEETVPPTAHAASVKDDPVVAVATEIPNTLPPVPTPTPEPTPTPTPTPVPTPTLIPHQADKQEEIQSLLMLDADQIMTVSTKGQTPYVFDEPNGTRVQPFERTEGVYTHEWIVLEASDDSGNYYHVRPVGAEGEYFIDARNAYETRLRQPESIYAILVRPRGILYAGRTVDSKVVAHASYSVVRVIGVDVEKGFAAILTPEGKTGYVELGQIQFVTEDVFNEYLHQSCEAPESDFSLETLASDAREYIGKPYADSAMFLFDLLRAEGLHFNEGYYRFYQKPLEDEALYPKHLYVASVYNSLIFKLFNSAGDLVTCNGDETEWAYIDDFEAIEEGDLLFFADDYKKGDPVIPNVEVVVHGRYSGDLTGCGLYIGDGRMLTVKNGAVADVEIDPVVALTFDSARRISPCVVDERAHFIECMISMIYDRLGTPYNSVRRTGDASYDCSGILNWVFRSFDMERRMPKQIVLDITAAAWGQVDELYGPSMRMAFVDTGIPKGEREELKKLQRGDLITLLNESRNRTGHVMVYLGNNTVIHSTRIDARYQGTLVAQFRPHLQGLFSCARRIDVIYPAN